MADPDEQRDALQVERVQVDGVDVLSLAGELDIATADVVVEHLDAMAGDAEPRVCVDLCGLEFMDSTGLQALIRGRNAALAERGRFAIACTPGPPRRVLELTGLSDVVAIAESRDEAVALLQRDPL